MIALTMLAAAVALPGYQQAVVDCVSQHAVELAKRTDAPAVDLAAAANAECFGTWQQARLMEGGMAAAYAYSPEARATMSGPMLTVDDPGFQQLVTGEAVSAIITARGH